MKKIMSFVVALILLMQTIISVSASTVTVVSDSKAPDYDVWMAQQIISKSGEEPGAFELFESLYEPYYQTLGKSLLNNKPLLAFDSTWAAYFKTEYRNILFTPSGKKLIYEIVLMDYLKNAASENSDYNNLTGMEYDFAKKLYSVLGKELNNNTVDYIDKELPVETAIKIWKNANVIQDIDSIISKIGNAQSNIEELINDISSYKALKKTKESTIILLKESTKIAPDNIYYSGAVNDIIKSMESTEIEFVIGQSASFMWNKFLGSTWDKISDSFVILKGIELTGAALDVCLDITNSASNNLKAAVLYTIDCYMSSALSNATEKFIQNDTSKNAQIFRECFEGYIQFQIYGCDYSKKWLQQYLEGGFLLKAFNEIFNRDKINSANGLLKVTETQINSRENLLTLISTLSEIYKVQNPLTVEEVPSASIRLSSSSLSIRVGTTTTLKAIVTGQSKAVKWKSSNSSIASVGSNGKITAKKIGSCIITAIANGKKATCKVTVKPANKKTLARLAYKELIQKYQKKYGKASTGNIQGVFYWKGLCFCKLLDFNGDGIEELILVYQNGKNVVSNIKYNVELWTFNGKAAKKVASLISFYGNNSTVFGELAIIKKSSKYMLRLMSNPNKTCYYGTKANGGLGIVNTLEWKWDNTSNRGGWYYNGKKINDSKYVSVYKNLNKNAKVFSFYNSNSVSNIKSQIAKTMKTLNL